MIVETLLVKLLEKYSDYFGYTTYVFKYLDQYDIDSHNCKLMICTRYPNWSCRELEIGDIGYVDIEIVKAGIDTYYNGEKQVFYKHNAKRFIKFIDKSNNQNKEEYTL